MSRAARDRGARTSRRSHPRPRPPGRSSPPPRLQRARPSGRSWGPGSDRAWVRGCRRRGPQGRCPGAARASSGQGHPTESLGGAIARPLAELLAAAPDPARDLVEGPELAGVMPERRDLPVEGCTDVDNLVRLVGAPQEQLGDLPRSDAIVEMLAKVERVAGGGKDGIDGALADGAMIGMVDPFVVHEEHRRVMRHHDLRAEGSNGVGEALAKPERWLNLAVRLVEEIDALDPDLGRGGALLLIAQADEFMDVGVRIVGALVAARDKQVPDGCTLDDPSSDGPGRAELDVVGMGGDDEHAFGGGQLVVRHRVARS